jgi:hypothetical protein
MKLVRARRVVASAVAVAVVDASVAAVEAVVAAAIVAAVEATAAAAVTVDVTKARNTRAADELSRSLILLPELLLTTRFADHRLILTRIQRQRGRSVISLLALPSCA